jgi:RNA 3'-terminal phosphate cyclase (ATP)
MIHIDGSYGEGGGQIIRSSLSLALVTGKPFTIAGVRARRKKPGLQRQHLAAVRAAAQVGNAEVRGAELGSTRFSFQPRCVRPGDYTFRIGTAGSTMLVLETLLPALIRENSPSTVCLEGGTHNPFAPPYDFIANTYLPVLRRMGSRVTSQLERYGFYPLGGGRVAVSVDGTPLVRGIELLERGKFVGGRVRAIVANLPQHIARRECDALARLTGWADDCFQVEQITQAHGPGNVVLIELHFAETTETIAAFGQKGVPAEEVAGEAWREAETYLASTAPVGTHLADQIMLPMAIAASHGCSSAYRTLPLSEHGRTHLAVIDQFLDVRTSVEQDDSECVVKIMPRDEGRHAGPVTT